MRLRQIKDADLKLRDYPQFVVFNPEKHQGRWSSLFPAPNPLHLEIGMGKGKFIIEQAMRHNDVNFIGCELSATITLKAARKVAAVNPPNLKLINCPAQDLEKIFAAGEITKIYLNFSDPWPKNRHEKRRLTSDYFLNAYWLLLASDGEIEFKTDNPEFYAYSLVQFNNHRFRFLEASLDLHNSGREDLIMTEYEERFAQNNQKIYYLKVKKWTSERE
ncbi:MAG TPA: tRNA (guanosine(46)-N7)-methyltransferase TrmB [Acholeplasmataceae bacterium]|jgi:tRNA (guanine-N7-)-methyltransferase|nr:tRNA (guanosine(46)-N7)-methyltransferase TrmB [Acholeplasmataceae bacterium]